MNGPHPRSLHNNPVLRVIPRSPPLLLADDEESRSALKMLVPKAPWSAARILMISGCLSADGHGRLR